MLYHQRFPSASGFIILVFTAMRKRGLCCGPVSVRLSVCPSVCPFVRHVRAFYPHGWRYRQTSFSARYLRHSSFWLPAAVPNSKVNPFSGGTKYNGVGNFLTILDWNRRLYRKRYEIGPWLLWNVNRKSYALYRTVIFSVTFTDP